VAAVDDVVRSSAVCAGDFGREESGRGTELVGDLYHGGEIVVVVGVDGIISSVLRKLGRAEDGFERADYHVPA